MNKFFPVSLASLAALLLAGSALAQTPDANRTDRRCTSATLSTDASTPCPDDVVNDRPGASPVVVRAPANSTAGSGNTVTGTQPSPGGTGTSTGTTGNMGAGSTGSAMGTTGMRR